MLRRDRGAEIGCPRDSVIRRRTGTTLTAIPAVARKDVGWVESLSRDIFETYRHSIASAHLCCAGGSRRLDPPYSELRLGRVRKERRAVVRWVRLRIGQSARSRRARELRRPCSRCREGGVKQMKRKWPARRKGLNIRKIGRALSFHRAVKRIASAVRDGALPKRRDQPGGLAVHNRGARWCAAKAPGSTRRLAGLGRLCRSRWTCGREMPRGGGDNVPVVATPPAHRARPSNIKTYGGKASRQGELGNVSRRPLLSRRPAAKTAGSAQR
jgi:hypothetical protein